MSKPAAVAIGNLRDPISPNRVQHHITTDLKQVAVSINQDRFIAALKKMTTLLVTPIAFLCVRPIKLAHPAGQVTLNGFNHQVIVVVHQAPGVTAPVESQTDLRHHFQPCFPNRANG